MLAQAQAFGADSMLVAAALPLARRWMCGGTCSGLWRRQYAGGSSAAFGPEVDVWWHKWQELRLLA